MELDKMAAELESAELGELECMIRAFAQVEKKDSNKVVVLDKVGRLGLVGVEVDFGLEGKMAEVEEILFVAGAEVGFELWDRMAELGDIIVEVGRLGSGPLGRMAVGLELADTQADH